MAPDLSERMLRAFVTHSMRSGSIDRDDITKLADDLEAEGDEESAHQFRAMIVQSHAPSTADWLAEKRRARMRGIDGGKKDD